MQEQTCAVKQRIQVFDFLGSDLLSETESTIKKKETKI